MRSFRVVSSAVITMLIALLPLAVAPSANAYPDPPVTIEIDPDACAGDPLPYFAESNVAGDWTVRYDGRVATAQNTTRIEGTFSTRKADAGIPKRWTATNVYTGGTISGSTIVTLTDCDAAAGAGANLSDDGLLPNTGGLSLWLMVLGPLAVVLGAGLLVRRRMDS